MSSPALAAPQPDSIPPKVVAYVEAFGEREAVDFLTEYGAETFRIPETVHEGTALARRIGMEKAARLLEVFGPGLITVPTSRRWLASQLSARGIDPPDIARRLRVTRESVRTYLLPPKRKARA